jgi:hypothetical protein
MADTAHIRSGDDLHDTLPAAGFVGDFFTYVDPVSEGPVPADGDLLEIRARYLADADGLPLDEVRDRLRAERDLPGRLGGYATVTLWFEHEWFCQAILVRLLAAVPDHPDLRLMSTDSFPGVDPSTASASSTPASSPLSPVGTCRSPRPCARSAPAPGTRCVPRPRCRCRNWSTTVTRRCRTWPAPSTGTSASTRGARTGCR